MSHDSLARLSPARRPLPRRVSLGSRFRAALPHWAVFFGLLAAIGTSACRPSAGLESSSPIAAQETLADDRSIRVAVFNVQELSREKLDEIDADGRGVHPQLRAAAEVIQRVRPDVLLLNEIDGPLQTGQSERLSDDPTPARLFAERYLQVAQRGEEPLAFPYDFTAPVNTGEPSGLDLNGDGDTVDPEDAWGFGRYPGQYGMAVLSRLPIDAARARTFRHLRWATLPGALLPDGQNGRPAYYPPEIAQTLRLSSKSHWVVPVRVGPDASATLYLLASHPTPPSFDGPEDHNGRRNFDEIRLLAEILDGDPGDHAWLVDDDGVRGGLDTRAPFVVLGDLNADPVQGDAADPARPTLRAIRQLLDHPRIDPIVPLGASDPPESATRGDRSPRPPYPGPPHSRTAAYGRIDYVLPSRGLRVLGSGLFLPAPGEPGRSLIEGPDRASDHFLVWVDLDAASIPILPADPALPADPTPPAD